VANAQWPPNCYKIWVMLLTGSSLENETICFSLITGILSFNSLSYFSLFFIFMFSLSTLPLVTNIMKYIKYYKGSYKSAVQNVHRLGYLFGTVRHIYGVGSYHLRKLRIAFDKNKLLRLSFSSHVLEKTSFKIAKLCWMLLNKQLLLPIRRFILVYISYLYYFLFWKVVITLRYLLVLM
jgi:hypothetical protein